MADKANTLLASLEERGCQARIAAARHVQDLRQAIEGTHQQGCCDEAFYQERLGWLEFKLPDSLPEAQTLIVAAVPSPQAPVTFTWKGEAHTLILPPTYVGYERVRQQTEDLIAAALSAAGCRTARAKLPLKLLAVCSGLGDYGRNNRRNWNGSIWSSR